MELLLAKASLILLSIISLAGLAGTVLCAMVLFRKEMKSSTTVLLIGLTFFDGFLLLTYEFYFAIVLLVLYYPKQDYTNVIPDLLLPINKTVYTGSIYTTVLVTLDRYFAVCWPLHARSYLTVKKSKYSIFAVLIFSIIINFPRWLEYSFNQDLLNDPENLLYPDEWLVFSDRYVLYYHRWIWTIAMYVIPILIIGILNFRIWKVVRDSNSSRDIRASGRSENSLTKMLLTLVTVFFILNILNCIVSFSLRYFMDIEPFELEVIACLPLILNSSLNFVIYCAMGQQFRDQFFSMTESWKYLPCLSRARPRSNTNISTASVCYTTHTHTNHSSIRESIKLNMSTNSNSNAK